MKRFIVKHIRLGSLAVRSGDEFYDMAETAKAVRPEKLRWFAGTQDLAYTFVCRAL